MIHLFQVMLKMNLLALTFLLFIINSSYAIQVTESYTRSLELKANGDYMVYWKVSGLTQDSEITFEIHARTLGWIGFGISPNGGMPGSDIVIGGWNDQTKQLYLYVFDNMN